MYKSVIIEGVVDTKENFLKTANGLVIKEKQVVENFWIDTELFTKFRREFSKNMLFTTNSLGLPTGYQQVKINEQRL